MEDVEFNVIQKIYEKKYQGKYLDGVKFVNQLCCFSHLLLTSAI